MSNRPTVSKSHQKSETSENSYGSNQRLGWLDAMAFFVLLLVVAMRPLLSETYSSSLLEAVPAVESRAGQLTPVATAWLDLAIWSAGLAAASAALFAKRRWRWTGIEIGAIILLVAAIVSSALASNKRLAFNASFGWLTALVVVVSVANLCHNRLRIGLLLAVLAASGGATVARCIVQKVYEFPETQHYYEIHKNEMWSKQNVLLDDPQVELFERRMKAAEASGFFSSSNTAASWLLLAGFSCLALRGLVVRDRRLAWILLIPAALIFATIGLTGSKGAIGAGVVGVLLWFVFARTQDRWRPHWRQVWVTAWIAVIGLAAAVLIYGLTTGRLPSDSLRFRWNYWQVTWQIISHNWLTGVGALNFDNAYLLYKPVQFPEEIRDPHNFILAIIAQWGILGGLGLAAVFLGGSYVIVRAWGAKTSDIVKSHDIAGSNELIQDNLLPYDEPLSKYRPFAWLAALSIGFVLLRLWFLRGWLMTDESGAAWVFFDLGLYGFVWIVTFAVLSWLIFSHEEQSNRDDPKISKNPINASNTCFIAYFAACLAGAIAFVLHNAIDSAMFYPGALIPFAAIVGLLVAARTNSAVAPLNATTTRTNATSLLALAVGTALLLAWVVLPVTRAGRWLELARDENSQMPERVRHYEAAMQADPFDSTAASELAMLWASRASRPEELKSAIDAIHKAIRRDPARIGNYRSAAELLMRSYEHTGSDADLQSAINSARKVVELYPASPEHRLELASLMIRGGLNKTPKGLAEIKDHYRKAIQLNDAREPHEIRRWEPQRRYAIERQLQELQ